ncbi:MAG TPA: TatD family hydrolase, partial [Alphaproteobacteria bacterium]|nr:TatD family hydrolase [Alphaproteobacteria bacterium]
MGLIDSHCHLDHFAEDRAAVIARARAAGVSHMVTICTRVRRFAEIAAIAEAEPDISCTVGTHPHQAAEEADVALAELLELARHPKVVGIGETGLDYYYDHSPRDVQQAAFRMHIRACLETGLPLIVHTRDADDDTARILREEGAGQGLRGVLHCFSSGRALAEAGLEMGFHISLSGMVTFGKAEEIRAIVRDVPLDRLLVETDAPYLAPPPRRRSPRASRPRPPSGAGRA